MEKTSDMIFIVLLLFFIIFTTLIIEAYKIKMTDTNNIDRPNQSNHLSESRDRGIKLDKMINAITKR